MRKNHRAALLILSVAFSWASAGHGAEKNVVVERAVWARQFAAEQGWIKGIREVGVVRPDLLSVRLDGGLVGSLSAGCAPAVKELGGPEDYDAPGAFVISSQTDPNYREPQHPLRVGRATYQARNCVNSDIFRAVMNPISWSDYYLFLPHPLQSGHAYRVKPQPARKPLAGMRTEWLLRYDEAKTVTRALKVNQVAYFALATRRYAYLGWWAGSEGPVDYSGYSEFVVIAEDTGGVVKRGRIALRAKGDELSGEDVYQLDLSGLAPGAYHIRIPGLARSYPFRVGGAGVYELYYHTMRALFHQRCGQALGPPYTWVERPACHTAVWKSGHVAEGRIRHPHGMAAEAYAPEAQEDTKSFKGGYHDAADYDTFAYHLLATAHVLTAYEQNPGAYRDGDLDIPESGNGVPDLLDEAAWGLLFHLEYQYDNGAVPMGRANECDATGQSFEVGKDGPQPPYGIIPPMRKSTPTFAAVAAQFARLVRPFAEELAEQHLTAAKKAFAYAQNHTPREIWQEFNAVPQAPDAPDAPAVRLGDGEATGETALAGAEPVLVDAKGGTTPSEPRRLQLKYNERWYRKWPQYMVWAAAELLRTTGEKQYGEYVLQNRDSLDPDLQGGLLTWAYLQGDGDGDAQLRRETVRHLLLGDQERERSGVDELVVRTDESAYRMGNGQSRDVGWGRAQGIHHGPSLLLAYWLTGKQAYLDAASLNADFHLGCNPLGKVSLTGMGYNPPRRPEISYYLYEEQEPDLGGRTVKGIGIYGIGPPLYSYPGRGKWPLWRCWRDIWGFRAEIYSEFTVHQTVGPSAMVYSAFLGMEREKGLIPDNAKPDPLDRTYLSERTEVLAEQPERRGLRECVEESD